ncbi:MAG TPA: hypothetical protein VGM05_01475 [Planctomycetaceae bacterium]|jgi:hypothetical protein
MDDLIFTSPDAWNGGDFELLLLFGHVEKEVVGQALAVLWSLPEVSGYWLDPDTEPGEQQRIAADSDVMDFTRVFRGIAELAGGSRVACSSSILALGDEDGWWLSFGIPMGSLGRAFSVGAYPTDDGTPTDWLVPVTEWFRGVAKEIFAGAPFAAGAIGWLTGNEADEIIAVANARIPSERWVGYLKPDGNSLEWFPPNQLEPLDSLPPID